MNQVTKSGTRESSAAGARRRVVALAIASVTLLPSHLRAQEVPDTFRLNPLVVTATRVATRLSHAPGSNTVLNGDHLRERGVRYVADALRTVPGVTVTQGSGPGALTSVFIRGGESDYVQVLVDGVQVNEPGGAFNWAHLRTDDVERIEVVRGAASVLYGSDAVSGVVQIFTRAGGSPQVDVGFSGGHGNKPVPDAADSFRDGAVDASLTGSAATALFGSSTIRYGGSYARHASNGLFDVNSDYDNTNLSGKLGLAGVRADLMLTARSVTSEFHFPTSGSGAIVDQNQFTKTESLAIGADAGLKLHRSTELRVLATRFDGDQRTDDPADNATDGTSWNTSNVKRAAVDARFDVAVASDAVFSIGAEREWQDGQTAFESVSQFGTFTDESDDARTNTGYYGQLHAFRGRFSATVGGRIDDNSAFGTFTTGRAALALTPWAGTRLHAAAGNSFREPTFFENFAGGFVRGNPGLEPESSRSWEIGAERTLIGGALVFGVTWFDQRFRNMILYTSAPPTPGAPNYFNLARATARGAELMLRGEAGSVSWNGSYTHTRTEVVDAGGGVDRAFAQEAALLRRPRHQFSGNAAVRVSSALRASLDVMHVGERDDLDFTDPAEWQGLRTELPARTTVDAGAVYRVLNRGSAAVDVTVRVRNLFDHEYQEIYNFPSPGRVLQLGVRAQLGL